MSYFNPFLSCLWKSWRFKYFLALSIFSRSSSFEHRFLNSLKKLLRECRSMEAIEKAQQSAVSAKMRQLFVKYSLYYIDNISKIILFTLVMNFLSQDGILTIEIRKGYSFRIFSCFGNFVAHQFTEILALKISSYHVRVDHCRNNEIYLTNLIGKNFSIFSTYASVVSFILYSILSSILFIRSLGSLILWLSLSSSNIFLAALKSILLVIDVIFEISWSISELEIKFDNVIASGLV